MPASQHYFYNIMRKTIIQFLDMFNDIVIARYNQDTGTVIKYVKVPLKFAPKTKQWYWTELREAEDNRDQVLPMMAIDLENVEYAQDRQVNRNHKVSLSNNESKIKQYFNPVPYDFTFKVQIAAEYMVDITQIIEQIFPFFTPESYIRITVPELNIEGFNEEEDAGADALELRVVYESASREATVELDEAAYRILRWDLTFKVQGYLFSPISEVGRVHNIVLDYYLTDDTFDQRDLDKTNTIGEGGNFPLQGLVYATDIPADSVPIDDSIKALFAYEHFMESNYVQTDDDEVWLEDDDGLSVQDDENRNVRE